MRSTVLAPLLAVLASSCVDLDKGSSGSFVPLVPLGFVGFETQIELDAGVAAVGGVSLGDLTGDFVPDLAVAGREGRLRILVGQGAAGFVPATEMAVATGAAAVQCEDLDGDGDRDVVVASLTGSTLEVFLNDGIGNMTRQPAVATAASPTSLLVADCNDDGDPDLLSTHFSSALVEVFLGRGDGTFEPAIGLTVPSAGRTNGLVVADVDGDSASDIVLADTDHDEVVVYHGDSTGLHDRVTRFSVGASPFAVAVADLTGDAAAEIVVSCVGDEVVEVYHGVGGGGFTLLQRAVAVGGPTYLAVADVTGDGEPDVLSALLRKRAITVFENAGSSALPLGREIRLGTTGGPLGLIVADLDADGRNDVLHGASGLDRINLFLGATGGLRGVRHHDAGLRSPATVDAADFDGDGIVEVVAGGLAEEAITILSTAADPSGSGHVLLGPRARLDTGDALGARTVHAVVARDVDGDGRVDVVAAVDGGVKVCRNVGGAGILDFDVTPAVGVWAPGAGPRVVDAQDVTADGVVDLVVAYDAGESIAIALGDADGGFLAPVVQPIPGGPGGFAIADVDADGTPELCVSLMQRDLVRIFSIAPDGVLTARGDVAVGVLPTRVVATDFDRDRRADLVISNGGSNDLSLLVALDDGSGFAVTSIAVGEGPTALLTEDLNNDGFVDVLASSLRSSDFHVLLGDGVGGIGQALVFPGAYTANAAVFADLNGSGSSDVIVGGFELGRVATFRNISR